MTRAIDREANRLAKHLDALAGKASAVPFVMRAALAAACVERQWPAFARICADVPWRTSAMSTLRAVVDTSWRWVEGRGPQPANCAGRCAEILDQSMDDPEETGLSDALFVSMTEFGMAVDVSAAPNQVIGIYAGPKDIINAIMSHARRLADDEVGLVLLETEMQRQVTDLQLVLSEGSGGPVASRLRARSFGVDALATGG